MLDLSDSPNSEFINYYNLTCIVDLLADEVVATEIEQEESDNAGDNLPGDIVIFLSVIVNPTKWLAGESEARL